MDVDCSGGDAFWGQSRLTLIIIVLRNQSIWLEFKSEILLLLHIQHDRTHGNMNSYLPILGAISLWS